MQSINSIETNAYGTSKCLACKKEEIECNNIIKHNKKRLTLTMLRKNIEEHNPNCSQIFDHAYRIWIIVDSGSGKTKALLNLIEQQDDDDAYSIIDKI